MGGVVKKVGAFGYELPAGESQQERRSNLLPLGEVTAGVFQHRSLLFKVRRPASTSRVAHMTARCMSCDHHRNLKVQAIHTVTSCQNRVIVI